MNTIDNTIDNTIEFRNYSKSNIDDRVRETYHQSRINQTVEYV